MTNEVIVNLKEVEKTKRFAMVASKFISDIDAVRNKYTVDAKSILGLLTLDLSEPLLIKINSNDEIEIRKFNEVMEEFK